MGRSLRSGIPDSTGENYENARGTVDAFVSLAFVTPATASASPQTHTDNRQEVTQNTLQDVGATSPSEASTGGCHGHANTPHSANDQYGNSGIGFDAYQDCVGDFNVQKLCVKLQEKDYYGNFYDRTALSCNAETVNPHSFTGRWVSCVSARSGVYRTYAVGYAYPDSGPVSNSGASTSASMCGGYSAAASPGAQDLAVIEVN